MASGKRVHCSIGQQDKHAGDVECIAMHGDRVYTGADDGVIKAWTLRLELVKQVQAHDNLVYHLVVSPRTNVLYSCSTDGTIHAWSTPDLKHKGVLTGHEEAVRKIRVLPDGAPGQDNLISGDDAGFVCMWEGDQLRQKLNLAEEVWDLALDSDLVFTARDRDVVVSLLKTSTNNVLTKATFSGRAPLCVLPGHVCFVAREGMDVCVHAKTEDKYRQLATLKGHKMIVNALAGSEKILYSGGWDKSVRTWDLDTFKCVSTIDDLSGYVNCLACGPPGTVYVGGQDSLLLMIA